jgi:hypothetical protein
MHPITDVEQITEKCRGCGEDTTDWMAVVMVRNLAHQDEVEITDAQPLTVLCRTCCTGPVEANLQLAVNTAINTKAA